MHIGTIAEDVEEVFFKEADVAVLGAAELVCSAEGFLVTISPLAGQCLCASHR